MSAVLGVEIRRILARRLVHVMGLLALAGTLAGGLGAFLSSSDAPDDRFHYVDILNIFEGTSPPLVIVAWIIGASFIGAEWQRGTMTTTLTWEPRRGVVFAAKVLATCVLAFFGSVLFYAVLAGALLPAGMSRGTLDGTTSEWLADTAGVATRAAALAVLMSGMGFAIASLGRNTAAAVAVGFVYIAIVENFVRGLRPEWTRWLVAENAIVVVTGEPEGVEAAGRSLPEALLLLLAYVGVALVMASTVFRRRDVT